MVITFDVDTEDEPVECDMHWDSRKNPHFIQPGEPVHYRMYDDAVEATACENCALHFKWDSADHANKSGRWGPE